MGVICRKCYKDMTDGNIPAVRTRTAPCDLCGSDHEMLGKNFDYPDELMPNNPNHPDKRAERDASR